MEKVVVFLDYANINRAARTRRCHLDYSDLLRYLEEGRFLSDAYCYVPINPRNEHRSDRDIEDLWRAGYLVTTKVGTIAGGTYKCNFDVEITMDVLKVAYQVKPDILVLATGDADFVPLIQEVRKSGIRVEIAAFAESVGAEILLKCSGFINLAQYYEDSLVSPNGEPSEERMAEAYQDLIQAQEHPVPDILSDKEGQTTVLNDDETNSTLSEKRDNHTPEDEIEDEIQA